MALKEDWFEATDVELWDVVEQEGSYKIPIRYTDVYWNKISQIFLTEAPGIKKAVLDLKIFASGLRNPQGMTTSSNGDIFFTDHGASGGDELNILIEGKNYGCALVSMGKTYTGSKFPNSYSKETSPIYS